AAPAKRVWREILGSRGERAADADEPAQHHQVPAVAVVSGVDAGYRPAIAGFLRAPQRRALGTHAGGIRQRADVLLSAAPVCAEAPLHRRVRALGHQPGGLLRIRFDGLDLGFDTGAGRVAVPADAMVRETQGAASRHSLAEVLLISK